MIEQFEEITFKHLPREENYLADALATLATMFKVNANAKNQLVKLEVRESQAHCACIQEEPDGNPWYHDIPIYVRDQRYPALANDNCRRPILSGLLLVFLFFCWASGPFASWFEFGPRTHFVTLVFIFIESLSRFCISYLVRVYLIVICR